MRSYSINITALSKVNTSALFRDWKKIIFIIGLLSFYLPQDVKKVESMPSPSELLPVDSPAPMILSWVITFIFCSVIIEPKVMSRRLRTTIYLITIFLGGVLLGGIPNSVMPIQYILIAIGLRGEVSYLLLVSMVLSILLFSSLLAGRIFCGFI